jgi:hypothetical protein
VDHPARGVVIGPGEVVVHIVSLNVGSRGVGSHDFESVAHAGRRVLVGAGFSRASYRSPSTV